MKMLQAHFTVSDNSIRDGNVSVGDTAPEVELADAQSVYGTNIFSSAAISR